MTPSWVARIPALALCLLLAARSSPLLADQPWYVHYELGEKALDAQRWEEAVRELTKAIELEGTPNVRVRTYGTRHVAYFPYFKLGQAYLGLGGYAQALQAFRTEEQLGAIAGSAEDVRRLKESSTRAEELRLQQASSDTQSRLQALLASSRSLQAGGNLDEALGEAGKAVAIDPKNVEAFELQERLRKEYSAREEARSIESRAAGFVAEGREYLAAGRYDAAAAAFGKANDLRPDAEVGALLAEARQKLKEQVSAAGPESTDLATILAEAARLEQSGQIDDTLNRLESALALSPSNEQGLRMRERLFAAKQAQSAMDELGSRVAGLVNEARQAIQAGHLDDALGRLTQALALDPHDGAAAEALVEVYKRITFDVLAPRSGGAVARIKIPPAMRFIEDYTGTSADGLPEQRVEQARYLLAGTIVSQSPVTVQFRDGSGSVVRETVLKEGKVEDIYVNAVKQEFLLRPGVSALSVVARDQAGQEQTYIYRVHYVRPWFRSPWAVVWLAMALAAGVVVREWRRGRRRRHALTRRFNPYIAGAPVLDDNIFLGREDLIARVLQTIHGNSILLHGERRIGKTTLLHHLKKRLQGLADPAYKFFPVYIDLQGTPEDRFFSTIARDVLEELGGHLGGRPSAERFAEGVSYGYYDLVGDLRQVLEKLQASTPKRVKLVLLIDEVDELNSYDPRVNQRLRSLFMKSFAEDMVAVVAGVSIRKHWESEGSPWYNFFEELEVKPFDERQAAELIERPIRDVFRFEKGLTQRVIALAAGRPYLIQKLCTALVDRAHRLGRSRLTLADLDAVREVVEGPEA